MRRSAMESNLPILVVGASGRKAGLVISALASRGLSVRGMIRKADKSDAVRRNGAPETVVADLTKPDSLNRACSSRINTPSRRSKLQPDAVHPQGRTPFPGNY
jgi:nucleoside-diphosphate-sugar epimerase